MSKLSDLVGQKFNKLLVIKKSNKTDRNRNTYWYCQCECGKEELTEVTTDALRNNRIKSCGCSRKKKKYLIGKTFGRWTVIDFGRYDKKNYYWVCKCSCGEPPRQVEQSRLINGRSKSCGCLARSLTSQRRKKDISGQKFNKLTAIRKINDGEIGLSIWECLCECGKLKQVVQGDLTSGKVKSCGCLRIFEDLTGKEIGWLHVVGRSSHKHNLYALWECKCKCGKTKDIPYYQLQSESVKSCGCFRHKIYDAITIGRKFGRLTAIKWAYSLDERGNFYTCLCECGNTKEIQGCSLRRGNTLSCGCLQKERASETHFKGTATLRQYCRARLKNWRELSIEVSNDKCVITGERFAEVHHVYPFSKILEEVIEKSNIIIRENMEEYTFEEIQTINYWNDSLHKKYGLGVCLSNEMHKKFHTNYGYFDFSFKDFRDFYTQNTGKEFMLDLSLNTR